MHKLHIGALGTLGVITQATFKLAPLPHTSATGVLEAATAATACELVMGARDAGLAIEAAEVLAPRLARTIANVDGWCALVRVAGSQAAADRTLRELRAIAQTLGVSGENAAGGETWAAWSSTIANAGTTGRVSVAPTRVADTLDAMTEVLSEASVSATVSAGLIRFAVERASIDELERARAVAEAQGGFLLIDAAPPEVKAQIDVFGAPRSDFPIMQRLKQQFDPNGTLSPGRFIGRL
jgi:glycolate oxidase FAD binding subunit